jgi:hypothetical protein
MTNNLSDEEKIKVLEAISLLGKKAMHCTTVDEASRLLDLTKTIEINCGDARSAVSCIYQFIIARLRDIIAEPQPGTQGVYVISYEDGHIKIGRTKDFPARIKSLSFASLSPISSSRFFECANSSFVEAYAHRHFKDYRLKNEFFSTRFEDACEFIRRAVCDEFHPSQPN